MKQIVNRFFEHLNLLIAFFFIAASFCSPLKAAAPAHKALAGIELKTAGETVRPASVFHKKPRYRPLDSLRRSVKSATSEFLVTLGWPLAGLGMIVGGLLFASGAAALAWVLAGSIVLGLFLLFLAALASINIC